MRHTQFVKDLIVPASRYFPHVPNICQDCISPCGLTDLFAEVTETVHHSAVIANAFREHTNLSGKQRDMNKSAPQLHKCYVLNSYTEGVTLRTPLKRHHMWGAMGVVYPAVCASFKASQYSWWSWSILDFISVTVRKRCFSKLHNCPSNYKRK